MKSIYYVTVAQMNKQLGFTENVKFAIPAESKEDAMAAAEKFGEVLYVDIKSFPMGEAWQ